MYCKCKYLHKSAWGLDNRLLQVLANTCITRIKNYVKFLQKKEKEKNATYLSLSNFGISVINAYLAILISAIFYCFSEQVRITRCQIVMSGDVEVNPEPRRNFCQRQSFSICNWNWNSLIEHNFAKVSLSTAYLSVNKFISFAYQKPY